MRERLQKADALQAAGKIDEAVTEMLAVAALYVARSVPNKALAVLRTAVRLRPANPDVRISYGEVLHQQRMNEDAAREYLTACQLYESAGQYGEWLDVMRTLLAIDANNLTGRLQLAEALSRAARYEEAAATLRELAEMLRKRGAIEDWEKVAERLVHHEAGDVSTAHELALHYVRSGRHADALAKLIVCYESVPGDAEMLELIIDTLESLGQREKAAIICRELVRTFRRTGLEVEANRALLRLHALAPDDAEARAYVGVLKPAVAADTVIELEVGTTVPLRRPSTTAVQIPATLPVQPAARPSQPALRAAQAPQQAPQQAQRPAQAPQQAPRPVQATPIAQTARATTPAVAPFPFPTVAPPPVPTASRPVFGQTTQTTVDLPPTVPLDALPPSAPRVQSPRATVPSGPPAAARTSAPAPVPAPVTAPAAPGRTQPPVSLQVTAPIELAPLPHVRWEQTPTKSSYGLSTPMPALEALAATLAETPSPQWNDDDDDEAGFDVEERTLVEDVSHTPAAPQPPAFSMPRPEAPMLNPVRTPAPPTMPADADASGIHARAGVLPRPRLARRVGTMTELPSTVRDMSKDIGTLDFFIERGFYESAVALYDALLKRHPGNAELLSYRARIDRMSRG